MLIEKHAPIRDRKYLDWLREQPCVVTGLRDCEPAHVGTLGKGIKSSDSEALPLHWAKHREAHQKGEISMFRQHLPDSVLREALRAYARERYREYLEERDG